VVNAWARFEDVLRREATWLGLIKANERFVTARTLIARLRDDQVIDAVSAAVATQLGDIRNQTAHNVMTPNVDAAAQFVETAGELIARVEFAATQVRLVQLMTELKAQTMADVRVGRLRGGGRSASIEVAREMAERRRGQWAARAKGVVLAISERDAAVLLEEGAKLVDDPERNEDS
jgi:hypothetical protein